MKKIKPSYLFILLFFLLSSLSLYKHKNIEPNTFRSEIWADRAGYYIYLPSTFIYSFSTYSFSSDIESRTGDGFRINRNENKIETKYTYGVALLQLPFFLVADVISKNSVSVQRDGFSIYYQKAIDIASVFYLTIGLYLLFLSLKKHFKIKSIIVTLGLIFLGTNLYYYGIIETGMSHVYSFFLFSCILYLLNFKSKFTGKYLFLCLFCFISWLIVLIRPTNIIFLLLPFIWETNTIKQIMERFKKLIDLKFIVICLFSFIIIFGPQFLYWKYLTGQFLNYSYGNETFSNLFSPKLLEVLFSPKNGLIPYSLIMPLVIVSFIFYLRNKRLTGIYIMSAFLIVCFLSASWHDWTFGCSCGMRNSVEYLCLFSFPLCFFVNHIFLKTKRYIKTIFAILLIFISIINFKINYYYFGCYFDQTWNWCGYMHNLCYPFN